MNQPAPMDDTEKDQLEKNLRRAAAVNALRKINKIVAAERQADAEKAHILRWFARYGWIILSGAALLLAYVLGLI